MLHFSFLGNESMAFIVFRLTSVSKEKKRRDERGGDSVGMYRRKAEQVGEEPCAYG